MAYFSTEPASQRRNPTGKSRAWDFFRFPNKTHPANRHQPAQPRRIIRPTPTKTASGIPYWPSRDPIGEEGGLNLYGFVWNDGIRRWDLIGLIEVKRGDNTVVNDVPNSSPDQGSVAASFTVELEAFRKAAHGSIGPRCCYRGKIVNWHIVTHLPPNAPDVISSADFKKWYEKWVTQNLRSRYINAGHPIYEATQAHEAVHVKQLEARIVDIEKHFKDTYGVESCYRTASERDDAMNWAQKAVGAPREYTPHDMPMTDTKLNSEADAIKAEWEVYKRKYENSNE